MEGTHPLVCGRTRVEAVRIHSVPRQNKQLLPMGSALRMVLRRTAHLRGGRELQVPHRGLAFLPASKSWSTAGERGAVICRKERGVNSSTGKVPASAMWPRKCGNCAMNTVPRTHYKNDTNHTMRALTRNTALHGKLDFSKGRLMISIPHNLWLLPWRARALRARSSPCSS